MSGDGPRGELGIELGSAGFSRVLVLSWWGCWVVPGDLTGVGSPYAGARGMVRLFAMTPMFSAGWGVGKPDEESVVRDVCLQKACYDVGSMVSKSTGRLRRSVTTSVAVGRRAGSCCQHLDVMFHTESVRPSSCPSDGRAGRPPPTIFKTMDGVLKLLNGYFPVKAWSNIQMSGGMSIPSPLVIGAGGARTNLYHNHAKSKNVRFLCHFVRPLENLRRGPPHSVPP